MSTQSQWPYTGRLSVAAHEIAVALLKSSRYTAELPEEQWDALKSEARVALLQIAEKALLRAVWVMEDRQRRSRVSIVARADDALREIAEHNEPRD